MTSNENGDSITFFVEGKIDSTTAPDFENAIVEKALSHNFVVLDFAKVGYVSSAGFRVLLVLQKNMTKKGGLKILNVSPSIMEVFEMTGFKEIFSFG